MNRLATDLARTRRRLARSEALSAKLERDFEAANDMEAELRINTEINQAVQLRHKALRRAYRRRHKL